MQTDNGVFYDGQYWRVKRLSRQYGRKRVSGKFDTMGQALEERRRAIGLIEAGYNYADAVKYVGNDGTAHTDHSGKITGVVTQEEHKNNTHTTASNPHIGSSLDDFIASLPVSEQENIKQQARKLVNDERVEKRNRILEGLKNFPQDYTSDPEIQEWMNAPMGAYTPNEKAARAMVDLGIRPANSIKPVTVKFGAIGDTHLCSKYERLDVLSALYDTFASEGITDVYHTGNYIDGEARFNFGDIHTHGMDDQIAYFVKHYPQRQGITTHFIAGDDHEGWYTQKNRIDIGKHTEDMARREGRADLVHLSYMEADIPLLSGAVKMRVLHAGGGSATSISHTSQKIVDSYSEDEKPHILLVGHYHKSEYLPNYRNVHVFQTGCTQEQTPFMRKKRLHADLGAWIISVCVQNDGVMRVSGEFLAYHPRKWEYR